MVLVMLLKTDGFEFTVRGFLSEACRYISSLFSLSHLSFNHLLTPLNDGNPFSRFKGHTNIHMSLGSSRHARTLIVNTSAQCRRCVCYAYPRDREGESV